MASSCAPCAHSSCIMPALTLARQAALQPESCVMKAVLKAAPVPGLELRTVPDPTPEYGEVVLQVKATSMCGTDGHVYQWDNWARQRIKPPRILGHEMYGEVVAIGKGVSSVHVGDRVAA